MGKKPGFQAKFDSDMLMYIIVGILIFGFIIFLPSIYTFVSKLKSKNVVSSNFVYENNNYEEEQIKENNNLINITLVCKKTESKPEGNLEEIYTFYYRNGNKLLRHDLLQGFF